MPRAWLPLLAFLLALALLWILAGTLLAYLGGALLLAALLSQARLSLGPQLRGLAGAWKARLARRRARHLDWSIIETASRRPRPKPDCERPETLGQCTGRDCLVYETCNFNIKKDVGGSGRAH